MRTNIPDIFSAGDVTSFPLTIRGDQRVNIGHWQMSQAQGKRQKDPKNRLLGKNNVMPGFNLIVLVSCFFFFFSTSGRVAALNMLKKPTKIESVPFFWTVLLGKSIRYTGRVFKCQNT